MKHARPLARALLLTTLVAVSILVRLSPSLGARAEPAQRAGAGAGPGAAYDLYASYPNLQRLQSGYFLRGTNRYHTPVPSSTSDRTSLWFQPRSDGSFKQFATAPYGECHWDLLRWGPGGQGLLRYLATQADCYADHTGIAFRPGIAYMPKKWVVGRPWQDQGVSQTVYSTNGIPVCDGTNTWQSRVRGLVELPDGEKAVHTQTNETQTLLPIAGAPVSSACPSGQETRFEWQENYYLGALIDVRSVDGSLTGTDRGLARSRGGNPAAARATGHPDWDSIFTKWEPLPPREVGTLTTSAGDVPNASGGNTIAFTYTAPATGLRKGILRITVPPGWTAPVTADATGCTAATAGNVATRGQLIIVSGLTLPANGQEIIRYGATSGGSCTAADGATAPDAAGAPVWRAEVRSKPGVLFTNFPATPAINVSAADGAGALTTTTTSLAAGSTGNTLELRFTAPTGGMTNGTLVITIPPGWTPPITTNGPGCTTAVSGTLTTSGQTIILSGLTLAANTSAVVDYGATAGGGCAAGDGVAAPPAPGAVTFSAREMSTPDGALTAIAASPTVIVG